MRRNLPTLLATLAVIGSLPGLATAQSGPPPSPPAPPAASQPAEPGPGARGPSAPGVQPNAPAPRRGDGSGSGDEAPQQGRGGCRYVPGKLDLIV